MLKTADIATYTAAQVTSLVDVDAYAVRAEGKRRQAAAEKKMRRLQRQMADACKQLADGRAIIQAAWVQIEIEQAAAGRRRANRVGN